MAGASRTDLTGKRAIVTGGSRGIGLRVAAALLDGGSAVTLVSRDPGRLEQAARSLSREGARVGTAAADVRSTAEVAAAVGRAVEAMGGVDILVNAAAQPADKIVNRPIAEFDEDTLRDELETKAFGYLRAIKAVAPHLIAQGWGRIVNIGGQSVRQTGSITATIRNAAVSALSKNLADELGPHGITVNVVHPGLTVTERSAAIFEAYATANGTTPEEARAFFASSTSNRRLNTADDIAALVAFLVSDAGIAVNGEALYAGGGIAGRIYSY